MAAKDTPPPTEDAPAKGGGKKKLVLALVAVLVVAGAAYKFVLAAPKAKGGKGRTPAVAASAKPGPVLKEDDITLNLAGGHYLRLGLALQLPATVAESQVDGSKALDTAIRTLSGRSMDSLMGSGRDRAVAALDKAVVAAYGKGMVSQVYLTDFVMQ